MLGGPDEAIEGTPPFEGVFVDAACSSAAVQLERMAQVIDLEGLPDAVAKAIAETVVNLKSRYRAKPEQPKPLKDLPSRPGKVIGSLRRVDIYDER